MDLRRFVAFCLLFLLGYLLYQARPVTVSGMAGYGDGHETEAETPGVGERRGQGLRAGDPVLD